jgi:hypothetical protein
MATDNLALAPKVSSLAQVKLRSPCRVSENLKEYFKGLSVLLL